MATAPGQAPYPVIQGRYKVEFSRLTGVFTDCQAVSAAVNPVPYQFTDGKPGFTIQAGTQVAPQIILKRGMTSDNSAWTWHADVSNGQTAKARTSGTISVLDGDGRPVVVFNVLNAWPIKVQMDGLSVGQNTSGTETITLACEKFERTS